MCRQALSGSGEDLGSNRYYHPSVSRAGSCSVCSQTGTGKESWEALVRRGRPKLLAVAGLSTVAFAYAEPKLLTLLVKVYLHWPRNAPILSWAAAGIAPSLVALCRAWFVATKKKDWASNYRGVAELLSPFPAPVLSKADPQPEQDSAVLP